MDKFIIEYIVGQRREVGGEKDGKKWRRIEYRGRIRDSFGNEQDCDAVSGFNAVESCSPKPGDHVGLVVADMSFRSAFPEVHFSDVIPLPPVGARK